MILFDTDVCLSLLAGNRKICQQFGELLEEICVPAPCVEELYLAAEQSPRQEENGRRIEQVLATVRVLHPDTETYRLAARLRNRLDRRGGTATQTDVLVYCLSKIFSARLVTLHAGRYRFT